jgi:hypothetical protein
MEPDEDPLIALFRHVEAPAPSPDFVFRTMRAVRREPLPTGRRRLRNPVVLFAGWAAVIAGVSLAAASIALDQPIFAATFITLLSDGIAMGVWLIQFAGTGLALLDLFSTTGIAVSRAVLTREGSAGLMLMAVVGAVSLSALHRLLTFEGPERGVSRWQEL